MIDKLNNHYAFENPASVYDEEAMTALQLAGRQGAKINEVIGAQNNLIKTTGERLEQQDQNITNIREVTVPADVKKEVQRKIDSGEFDASIDEHMGGLNQRVDNLIGSLPEGPTTRDAEVIDGRISVRGFTRPNIGAAIRAAEILAERGLNYADFDTEEITGSEYDGWFSCSSLSMVPNASYKTISVNVNPGEVYFIQAKYGYDVPDAAVFDASGGLVHLYHTNPNNAAFNRFTDPIVIPSNGATLKVCSNVSPAYGRVYNPIIKKVVDYRNTSGHLTNIQQGIVDFILSNATTENGPAIVGTLKPYCIINEAGDIVELSSASRDKYHVRVVPVTGGDILHVVGSANYGNHVFAFYKGASIVKSLVANTYTVVNDAVVVPYGADTLCVASEGDFTPEVCVVEKVRYSELSWSHIKWVCLGDSLTEENIRTTKHYHDYIADKTGITVVNMGKSGTGYKNDAENGQAFYQRALDVPGDADVITIFGSGNDNGHAAVLGSPTDTGTATICGCVNTCLDNIYTVAPGAQVGIVSPTPWSGHAPYDPDCDMARYSDALREICRLRGVPFLDLYHESTYRVDDPAYQAAFFSKDPEGVACHPDENGHKIIAPRFYNFLASLIGAY